MATVPFRALVTIAIRGAAHIRRVELERHYREGARMPRENTILRVGDPAPDFCLRAIDGREVRLSDFRDSQHILLLFFLGTW